VPVAWRWPERIALALLSGLALAPLVSYVIAFTVGVSPP